MSDLDTIHQIARRVLVSSAPSEDRDDWLWDRTTRILRNIEHICRLPELAEQAITIDRFCLVAAAYFVDSGWVGLTGTKNAPGLIPSPDITNAELCNISTQIVSGKLASVISDVRIDKINKIITESFNRFTDVTEAKILSDGRSLEELGAAGLIGILRRQLMDGKGISDILESWKRKVEYGYWQARLKESFRFAPVRTIAKKRFAAAERFMNQLEMENSAGDLAERLTRKSDKK